MKELESLKFSNQFANLPEELYHRQNWSPFENKTFKSRVLHTLVNGNLVFSHGKIIESGKGMKIMFER